MHTFQNRKKVVLTIAGHDPSGGAGIQADIESIIAAGCQAVSLVTALTVQNTSAFHTLIPQAPDIFRRQCDALLSDITIDACKIGLIGDLAIASVIAEVLNQLRVPVVFDPILKAGTGVLLTNPELNACMLRELFPRTTVLTPNCAEARQLTGSSDIHQAGELMLAGGCQYVLVTGADEATTQVTNILFAHDAAPVTYQWERLPGIYHGSGCTLSAAIAARLALDSDIPGAVAAAQEYTWNSLRNGLQLGHGQLHPNRFYQN